MVNLLINLFVCVCVLIFNYTPTKKKKIKKKGFCSFDLSCPILENDHFIKNCILTCLVLLNSILF